MVAPAADKVFKIPIPMPVLLPVIKATRPASKELILDLICDEDRKLVSDRGETAEASTTKELV